MTIAAAATLAGLAFQSVGDASQSGQDAGLIVQVDDTREFASHSKGKKKKKKQDFLGGGSFTSDPHPTLER